MEKHAGRWALMHIKDLQEGRGHQIVGGRHGYQNGVKLLALAGVALLRKKAGVKHYFIEDESPQCWNRSLQSLKYLKI